MAPREVEIDGLCRRSRRGLSRWLGRASLLVAIAPVAGATLMALFTDLGAHFGSTTLVTLLLMWLGAWLGLYPALAIASGVTGRMWKLGELHATANASGLTLDRPRGALRIPSESIAGAFLVSRGVDEDLEITTRRGDVFTVEVPTSDRGSEALEALGFDGAGRRVAIALGDASSGYASGCGGIFLAIFACCAALFIGGITGALGSWLAYALGVIFVVTALLGQRAWEGKRVVVGTDGVWLDGVFKATFVPRHAIARVVLEVAGTYIVKKDGRRVKLGGRGTREAGLAARIQDALQVVGEGTPAVASLLDRGGRAIAEWRESLRSLARKGAGYRRATHGTDDLIDVARDATAPIDRRIAAAIAIGASGDEQARTSLRVATEGLASDQLRVAMEKAAADELDDEALEEALRATC